MIQRSRLSAVAIAAALSLPATALPATRTVPVPPQPKAPRHAVTDTYWGVRVPDDYQYMEHADDPAVRTWVLGQDAATRAWVDRHPDHGAILDRITSLTHSNSPDYYDATYRSGRLFVMKEAPPKEQPLLVSLADPDDPGSERPVVDPNVIDTTGTTAIDFYVPSRDGSMVAVSMSQGGTEDGTLTFYDAVSGRRLDDVIPRVNGGTAGGSVAWNADGTGVFYTRYPREGERAPEDLPFYQQIWFHAIGTPEGEDTYVLGREFPKIAEIALRTSPDGQWLLADVSNGDGGEHGTWLRAGDGSWTQVATFEDDASEGTFGEDGALYFLSRRDAPRKQILRVPLATPHLDAAQVVVPQSDRVIESFTPTATRIYVQEMVGGPTQIRVYDLAGKEVRLLTLPEIANMGQPVRLAGDDVLFRCQSYTTPPAYYRCRPSDPAPVRTALAQTSPADFSDCEVRRVFAPAEDGTPIPINLLMRKGTKLDGTAPLLLYGYGSYGLSEQPRFSATRQVWLEQGGIWADASVRGGGEYGEAWHDAARLGTKQVSMDDFAACARYLVRERYTSKSRLAIEGGSAGGLLVYGTLVHHPNDMQAAVAYVGYGDVLRTELSPNGEFNTTEFGTVKDSTQFRGMFAYSPYHHVIQGTKYPSVLALTGVNDPRVEPWETYKMVARLQASGSPNPTFMRVSQDSGHGIGTALSERDRQLADVYLFLFDRLGVPYRAVPTRGTTSKAGPSL
ncbi:MAG: prolyl oligopeptidase family serine peptidase [Hyphomicrobiales bacterium]